VSSKGFEVKFDEFRMRNYRIPRFADATHLHKKFDIGEGKDLDDKVIREDYGWKITH